MKREILKLQREVIGVKEALLSFEETQKDILKQTKNLAKWVIEFEKTNGKK